MSNVSQTNMPPQQDVEIYPSNHEQYPNETIKLLLERASVRNFADREIPDQVLDFILKAGVHSASGGNLQPYSIIKIKSKETKERFSELCGQGFIAKAPVNLVFCIDFHRLQRWAELEIAPFSANCSFRHFWISFQDTIIAAQSICTAADSMGLGSVYIGTIIDSIRETKEILALPKGVFPVVLLCLGYPAEKPQIRRKLAPEIIIHDEKYREIEDKELLEAFNRKYPDVRFPINDERLNTIKEVCLEVHGEEYAQKCLEKIKTQGYINAVQRYFGLHYSANLMPKRNEEFIKLMEESGFMWFKEW